MPEFSASPKSLITIDCRGLFCPVPIIRTARALRFAEPGTVVELLADDPGVPGDMEAWSKGTGNRIVQSSREEGGIFRFRVQKS